MDVPAESEKKCGIGSQEHDTWKECCREIPLWINQIGSILPRPQGLGIPNSRCRLDCNATEYKGSGD
jgi:hypothetical protein